MILLKRLFLLSSFLFLFNCQEKVSHDKNDKLTKKIFVFNKQEWDLKYNSTSNQIQNQILLEITKKKYSNKIEVKNWLKDKIYKKLNNDKDINSDFLSDLCYNLYHSYYDSLSVSVSNFAIYSDWSKKNDKKSGVPLMVLSNYYKQIHELDSLEKFNGLLYHFIHKDTIKALPIIYYANLAAINEKKGNFFQSIINYHKAIDLTPKNDKKNLQVLHHDLAIMYLDLDYIDKAYENIQKSLKYKDYKFYPLDLLNTVGIIYSKAGDYNKANLIFNEIINEAIVENHSFLLAQTYANFANLKRKEKKFDLALNYMRKSDSICINKNFDFGILINQINRAEVYFDQQQFQQASNELEKSKKLIEQINDNKLNIEYYKLYFRVRDQLKDSKLANTYYRLYNENKETFYGDLSKGIIAEWELQNQVNKSIQLKTDYELKLQKKNEKVLWIILIAILIISLVGLFYFLSNKKKRIEKEKLKYEKQKIAYELEIKTKELLAETLNNISISSLKESIYEELKPILSDVPKPHQSKLLKLAKTLKQNNDYKNLQEFNLRFTQVYDDFYKKLLEKAPNLTNGELNVCALIRLNLSSKEIAPLTNRTVGTVENIRISIRKKLNLSPEVNLQQELFQF